MVRPGEARIPAVSPWPARRIADGGSWAARRKSSLASVPRRRHRSGGDWAFPDPGPSGGDSV